MQLTPEAKIASDFYLIRAIFAVVGFVSALGGANIRAAFRMRPTLPYLRAGHIYSMGVRLASSTLSAIPSELSR